MIAAAAFIAAGVVLVVMSGLGAAGKLPRNGFAGIRTSKTTASHEAWNTGHRAAAGYTAAAAAASIAGGAAVIGVAHNDAAVGVVAIGTAAVTVGLMALAVRRAHEAIDEEGIG